MIYTPEQVEAIVLEVIRRLGLLGLPQQSPASELSLTERVVTLRSVEGRLAGVRRLVVARRAVVTPAVKDELKQRKIELVRHGSP
jgi:hypothetical protein